MKKLVIIIAAAFCVVACSKDKKSFDATGTFEATEIIVSSEANGKIMELNLDEGSKLNSGDVVGIIDTNQLDIAKRMLLQGIELLKTQKPNKALQMAPLYSQMEKLRDDKHRVENLLKSEVATQKQFDDIVSAINILQKQIDAQEDALRSAIKSIDEQVLLKQIELEKVEDMLSKSSIISPISGTVLAKYVNRGELTGAGKPVFKIADIDNIYLKAYFTSEQLASIKLGNKVKIKADFGGDQKREYEGTIIWISENSEFTPKNIVTSNERANMVYAVKISLVNDGYVKIGMYGEIYL